MRYSTFVLLLPMMATLLIDRLSKNWFLSLTDTISFGGLSFYLHQNFGFMMGSLANLSQQTRVLSMSTLGCGLIITYFLLVVSFPLSSHLFQIGISVFFTSALSNIIDRIHYGYVIDGIQISTPWLATGVFNLADALQWIGIVMIFWVLIFRGHLLWPQIENRGGWINPKFQIRLSLKFLLSGIVFTIIALIYSYSFFRWSLSPIDSQIMRVFTSSFLAIGIASSFTLFYLGKILSARIAGPIFAFERFLDNLILGQVTDFKLRNQDEAFQFQELTLKFQELFNEKIGIEKKPLPKGYLAPGFHSISYNNKSISLENYRGQKVWICLLRYATCPICSYFLMELNQRADSLINQGLQVLVVFDSPVQSFLTDGAPNTKKLLSAIRFPVLFDPQKSIYRKYRARNDIWAVLRPRVVWTGIKALLKGFLQGKINGDIDQVPAHILINPNGQIYHAHYGRSIDEHIPWLTIEEFIKG